MIENIAHWIEIAFIVVGACSTIVLGLEKIAGVTPSTKDDEYVSKAKKGLGWLSDLLSKLALNPKK